MPLVVLIIGVAKVLNVFSCFPEVSLELDVYLSSYEENVHTYVYPEHKKHYCCKASIEEGCSCKVINIEGIYI